MERRALGIARAAASAMSLELDDEERQVLINLITVEIEASKYPCRRGSSC